MIVKDWIEGGKKWPSGVMQMIFSSTGVRVTQVYSFVKTQIVLSWSVHFTVCKKEKANWELCVSGALPTDGFHYRNLGCSIWRFQIVNISGSSFWPGRYRPDCQCLGEPHGRRIIHYVDCHLILLFSVRYPSPSAGFSGQSPVSSSTSKKIKSLVSCTC